MNNINKIISLLTSKEKKKAIILLLLVAGMSLFETVGVASIMPFLAVIGNPDLIQSNNILNALFLITNKFGIHTPKQFLIILGIGSFLILIISSLYKTITQYFFNDFVELLRFSVSSRLLESFMSRKYEFFLNRNTADISKTILSESDQLISTVFRPLFLLFASLFIFAFITLFLIYANPTLALSMAIVLSGLYILIFLFFKKKIKYFGESLVVANKYRYTANNEAITGIKIIKLLGCSDKYVNKYKLHSKKFAKIYAKYATIQQIPNYLVESVVFGTLIGVTLFLILGSENMDSRKLGDVLPLLGMYAFAVYRMKPAVQQIYSSFSNLRYGSAIVDNVYKEMINEESFYRMEAFSDNLKIDFQKDIILENVTYSYPKSSKKSLVDFNIMIPLGTSLGIVGSTGSGKTTLVDIILGLLNPSSGSIKVDDLTVDKSNLRSWQNLFGYVPQEIFLTDSTILENLAFGIPKDSIDQKQVENCAQMAQIHDFINELPEGYETVVGERGVRLSGGQRQRIGIARALYRKPKVLVFDEATSALDSITEKEVVRAINNLTNELTTIIVAHRLSTVQNCDQIILLDCGKVKEIGSYERLLEESELFRNMALV